MQAKQLQGQRDRVRCSASGYLIHLHDKAPRRDSRHIERTQSTHWDNELEQRSKKPCPIQLTSRASALAHMQSRMQFSDGALTSVRSNSPEARILGLDLIQEIPHYFYHSFLK